MAVAQHKSICREAMKRCNFVVKSRCIGLLIFALIKSNRSSMIDESMIHEVSGIRVVSTGNCLKVKQKSWKCVVFFLCMKKILSIQLFFMLVSAVSSNFSLNTHRCSKAPSQFVCSPNYPFAVWVTSYPHIIMVTGCFVSTFVHFIPTLTLLPICLGSCHGVGNLIY